MKLFFLLMLVVMPWLVSAAEVDNLYRAVVPVANQAQQERNRAIGEGFREVVVKVTGNPNIAQTAALQDAFRQASGYVQQFRYEMPFNAGDEEAGNGLAALQSERRMLRITFDKPAVDRILRAAGQPVWGKSRPQILVWLGLESGGQRQLLDPQSDAAVVDAFRAAADKRGLPVLFPLFDLQDRAALSSSDLWGSFASPVRQASARYAPDYILTVLIRREGGQSRASLSLLGDQELQQRWSIPSASTTVMAGQAIDRAADFLARRYVPAAGSVDSDLLIQVAGIGSFADYLKIVRFFDNNEQVEQHQALRLNADQAVFKLALRGDANAFYNAINLTGFMQPEDRTFLETSLQAPLNAPSAAIPADATSAESAAAGSGIAMPPQQPGQVMDIQRYYRLMP